MRTPQRRHQPEQTGGEEQHEAEDGATEKQFLDGPRWRLEVVAHRGRVVPEIEEEPQYERGEHGDPEPQRADHPSMPAHSHRIQYSSARPRSSALSG